MILSISWPWPGAILTFFYIVLFIGGVQVEASDVLPYPRNSNGDVSSPRESLKASVQALHIRLNHNNVLTLIKTNVQLRERAQPPFLDLRLRDPNLLGALLGGNKGGKGGNKAAQTLTQLVTVTKTLPNNATTIMMTAPAAATTVFVTMPAETLTSMIMMTVTATAPADPNAPAAPAAAAAVTPAPPAPQGMGSDLTLGFLTTQNSPTPLAQNEVAVDQAPTSTPMVTGTVFGILTETRTSMVFVTDDDAAGATGVSSSTSTMRSEGVSGRQAGTRCMGFGAVVFAIWVAVLIL